MTSMGAVLTSLITICMSYFVNSRVELVVFNIVLAASPKIMNHISVHSVFKTWYRKQWLDRRLKCIRQGF